MNHPKMEIKIGSLNLCLGLQAKKELVKQTILCEKIDILCKQETELNKNLDHNLLSFPEFAIETENNTLKSRVGIYVSSRIDYVRKLELEGVDSNLIIIDLMGKSKCRIINLYRSFSPQNGESQRDKFNAQLELINLATTPETILIGGFNLDLGKSQDVNYSLNSLQNV